MRRNFRVVALPLLAAAMSLTSSMFCQAADLLDRIKEKKEIVIASEARYAPFEYVEEGKIVGYDVDIFDKMMTALPEVKVTRLDLPFQGLLPGLQTSKFDAIITAITVTAQRFDSYKLSLPIADATFAVVKRKGDDSIKSPDDLAGKVIGTQAGSAQLQGAKRFSDLLQAKGLKPISDFQTYVDFNEAYSDLAAGRTDAVVNSLPNLSCRSRGATSLKWCSQPLGQRPISPGRSATTPTANRSQSSSTTNSVPLFRAAP